MGHKSDNFLISWSTVIAIVPILKLSWLLLTVSYHSTTLSLVKKTNAFMLLVYAFLLMSISWSSTFQIFFMVINFYLYVVIKNQLKKSFTSFSVSWGLSAFERSETCMKIDISRFKSIFRSNTTVTLLLPEMINMSLLPIVSVHYLANRWWEYSNLSGTRYYLDWIQNSWNQFTRKCVAARGEN